MLLQLRPQAPLMHTSFYKALTYFVIFNFSPLFLVLRYVSGVRNRNGALHPTVIFYVIQKVAPAHFCGHVACDWFKDVALCGADECTQWQYDDRVEKAELVAKVLKPGIGGYAELIEEIDEVVRRSFLLVLIWKEKAHKKEIMVIIFAHLIGRSRVRSGVFERAQISGVWPKYPRIFLLYSTSA